MTALEEKNLEQEAIENGFLGIMNNFMFGRSESQSKSFDVDIYNDEKEYHLIADLPGVNKDEIDIEIEKNILSITTKYIKTKENQKEKIQYLLRERSTKFFERKFSLPEDADSKKITAEVKNGQLLLSIPKTEKEKPFKIKVKPA